MGKSLLPKSIKLQWNCRLSIW